MRKILTIRISYRIQYIEATVVFQLRDSNFNKFVRKHVVAFLVLNRGYLLPVLLIRIRIRIVLGSRIRIRIRLNSWI
jgi:hypothetical protein